MKKMLFIVVLLFGYSTLMAQTNFRNITYAEAVAAAKKENKPVFIDFYTTWCGPWKIMSEQVFPQKSAGDFFNPHFVCIKIDAEKGEGVELAKRFNVGLFPTFLVLDKNENLLVKKVGASSDVELFTLSFRRVLDPKNSPERLKARYESGERNAELISTYTIFLMDEATKESGMMPMGALDTIRRVILDYFNGLTNKQKLAAENFFIYKRYLFPTPLDPLGRFMLAHRNEFAPEIREKANQHLEELFQAYVDCLLSGNREGNATEIATVKKEMNELGYNDDKRYDPVFKLIESYAKGDMNAYIDCCEKEFSHLDESGKDNLIAGMFRFQNVEDLDVLKRLSKFLRSHLSSMSTMSVSRATKRLDEIEKKISVQ